MRLEAHRPVDALEDQAPQQRRAAPEVHRRHRAQATYLGLTIPDAELRLEEAAGHYSIGTIDWDEFHAVLKGNGPCNRERLEARASAWDEGAWVREAAADARRKVRDRDVEAA